MRIKRLNCETLIPDTVQADTRPILVEIVLENEAYLIRVDEIVSIHTYNYNYNYKYDKVYKQLSDLLKQDKQVIEVKV